MTKLVFLPELKTATGRKKSAYPRAPEPVGEDMGANLCLWAQVRVEV